MGHRVSVVSKHQRTWPHFDTVADALNRNKIEYAVISNRTCDHYQTLLQLIDLGYCGPILVEKPLFETIHRLPAIHFNNVFVGYHLRFHPFIQKIFATVNSHRIISIQAYVGQYLPEWRTGIDYRNSYSASRSQGGGVLRDLSHELDYVTWIAGECQRIAAIGGTFGELDIDSDDVYCLLMETKRCPSAVIQMNYLDRKFRREIIINLEGISIKADLVGNTLEVNNDIRRFDISWEQVFMSLHRAVLSGHSDSVCTFEQGLEVVRLIQRAEIAVETGTWQ
jgi:predicted dehydrogenase